MAAATENSAEVRGPESRGDVDSTTEEDAMSKGMERKKEGKKKPAKTLEEKRAAKKAKRESRG
jgi:hypothetical protein